MKVGLLSIAIALVSAWSFGLDLRDTFIVGFEAFFLLYFLNRAGRTFVFLELLALVGVTQWLFAPMIAEAYEAPLDVSYDTYMGYALPATCAYVFGLTLPLWTVRRLDEKIRLVFERLSVQYGHMFNWNIVLIVIGFLFWITQTLVPRSLSFIFYLCAQLMMIGMCLMMFSTYRRKYIWIGSVIVVLMYTTLLNGMVGTVLFWLLILGMIYTTRYPYTVSLVSKILIFMVFLYVLVALQITKMQYRYNTWEVVGADVTRQVRREVQKDPGLFYDLFKENLSSPRRLLEPATMQALAVRLNQGEIVASTMLHVPRIQKYGKGEVTIFSTLSAFVPRILWPGKPLVARAEYFRKYTGITLGLFTSATLGPIGDAYADFGKWGVLFLLLFGGLIGGLFTFFVDKSQYIPSLLIWFMVLYFGSITVSEISVASYLNLLFKYIVFIIVIRYLFKLTLKISI